MMWLYHAFWWHTLVGMTLMAYGCWSPEVMTQKRIANLNKLRMPVWFLILFIMVFAMCWLPIVVADLALRKREDHA